MTRVSHFRPLLLCYAVLVCCTRGSCIFFQAEDGIRDLVRSRGLGDVYKRQVFVGRAHSLPFGQGEGVKVFDGVVSEHGEVGQWVSICLLYTSDAADERSSVDLGGRRIIKKKKKERKGG